jgi:Fis family transcriptional regulator, factor for inversion stimulation protein
VSARLIVHRERSNAAKIEYRRTIWPADCLTGFCIAFAETPGNRIPSVNRLMKLVIVQILPVDAPASDRVLDSSAPEATRQEVIPINESDDRSDRVSQDAEAGIRMEAVVSEERARSVVDSVLNVNELSNVDSFEKMIDLLIDRELASDGSGQLFHRVMSCVEKTLVEKAFVECGHVQTRTAERLGVNRNTIHKKLLKHDLLDPEDEEMAAEADETLEKRRCI